MRLLPELLPHLGPLDEGRLSYAWTHPDPRMDRLQQRAVRLVEEAVKRGQDNRTTLAGLRALALEVAGGDREQGEAVPAGPVWIPRPSLAPRLTEPWFC